MRSTKVLGATHIVDEERVASELKGNTLRVYWCLLEASGNSVGPRGVQKRLSFSSPALAVYHLDKLVELGLVAKSRGAYHLLKMVEVGVLKQFMAFKGFLIPRHALYATMLTTLLLFYISQFREVSFYSLFALIFGLLAVAIQWFETVKTWRDKPF